MNRRKFIIGSSLATGALLIPRFIKTFDKRSNTLKLNHKKLVVVQLSGGNDGLNTVIPFRNDLYYSLRPEIGIKRSQTLELNDESGLNSSLTEMRKFFDNGELCIINNVGYPEPDYSHFRSMDIWQTAGSSKSIKTTGWLGRYLDELPEGFKKPHMAIDLDKTLTLALKGVELNGFALDNPLLLEGIVNNKVMKQKVAMYHDHSNESNSYLHKTLRETFSSSAYILEKFKSVKSKAVYPNNIFSKNLRDIATLIKAQSETSVYYASTSGFDTHSNQIKQQNRYLKDANDALGVFVNDLKENDSFNDVLIMVFSEFGRRVKQNSNNGTDHGAANVLFLISDQLKSKGFYNELPDLLNLIDGNIKHTVDFRSVYATIVSKWLNADSEKIIGKCSILPDLV